MAVSLLFKSLSETNKYLMEMNNLVSKRLAFNGKTPAPEPWQYSHCALLDENITLHSFFAFQNNYILFFSTQFYPFFVFLPPINQSMFICQQQPNGISKQQRP